ncbi:glutamyl-tRNA reductase [Tamilnaduibacter salinus]|uniref:Glutamyl-tRNA reductase n=1 Tax=Tamilnaduibacter salinus TaxID=1484056 RepID=A0A2A2I7E1_9GAMM|nr:glutamyl-tRNA reductase [Tamilnaduibacter salinus]PAV27236.1 glutamyl-tRNA reductase [Tamilnaduibacter salinus]PVY78924.1 glutamyl-tRNA reductase [Tamilnaduibacter salinus]
MALLTLGINHRTAPLALRERVAFTPEQLPVAFEGLRSFAEVDEAAILSTCNRTELYLSAPPSQAPAVLDWLADYHGMATSDLEDAFYQHRDEDTVRHLMRVACGLDSMVMGEPQIFGQLKDAYATAQKHDATGPTLSRLFEHSFSVAKRVRTDTSIGENPVSVAYAAVSMARHIFPNLRRNPALLIGAGRTVDLLAQHLRQAGAPELIVANRTLERAEEVAERHGGRGILLSDIPAYLPSVDIVIASTASQLPVLGKGAVERALKSRKHRPYFMVDLAVPRDIEPEVSQLDDVYLYTVDDLRQVVEENVRSRKGAAQEAERLIEDGAEEFLYQLRALDAVATLKQFRQEAEQLRDREVARAIKALHNGGDPETLLRSLARGVTNKLLHEPTAQVRRATADGRTEVTDWLRELFSLEDRSEEPADPPDVSTDPSPGSAGQGAKRPSHSHDNAGSE